MNEQIARLVALLLLFTLLSLSIAVVKIGWLAVAGIAFVSVCLGAVVGAIVSGNPRT